MPVDLYVGGAEHAVLHLLYSRFWHKVLFDRGHVHTPEPFQQLVNQGMILGEMEYTGFKKDGLGLGRRSIRWRHGQGRKDQRGSKRSNWRRSRWRRRAMRFVLKENPTIRVDARAYKMSKSRGNVINPDDVVKRVRRRQPAALRDVHGPAGSDQAVEHARRRGRLSLPGPGLAAGHRRRAPRNVKLAETPSRTWSRTARRCGKLHRTIQKVTDDLDGMRFNTAIAAMMEFTNHLTPLPVRPRSVLEPFVLLLSPFAPHLAEELWHALGHKKTLAYEPWPTFDPALTKADEIEVPVQINGKLRHRLTVPADIDDEDLEAAALADGRCAS